VTRKYPESFRTLLATSRNLIGGLNANVMYEVGYAHALKKEVILLNNEHDAPFDLKDFRWIMYHIGDLQEVKDKLPRFLRNSLRLD
jgi:hypothetical protein